MHFRSALDGGGLRKLWSGEPLLHGRAPDRDLRDSALPLRRRPRLHQQAALRPQARPRHPAAPLRARVPHRPLLPRPRARSRRVAPPQHPSRPTPITANQMQVRTIGLATCLERVIEKSGYRREAWAHAGRPRHRPRGRRLPDRRGAADLLEPDAPLRRADQGRSRWWRHRLLRLDRHRPGLRLGAGRRGGRGAGDQARGRSRGQRRHRPDACRPGLVLVARDPDDRQCRDPGGASRTPAHLRRGGPQAGSAHRPPAGGRSEDLRRGTAHARVDLRAKPSSSRRRRSEPSGPRAPTRLPAASPAGKGREWARARPTRTPRRRSRSARTARPASSGWTRCGSLTTSARP